jgi:DNA-binding LacI/PurR family transcriptional regulator
VFAVKVSKSRRVTATDVAREAGVSQATVSYVLNNAPHQKIAEATRQRILAAAERLGYAPSAAARALRNGRSDVVLCLLPDWPISLAVGSLLEYLSAALAAEGLSLVAHPHARNDRPITELWKAITPAAVIAFDDFPPKDATAMRAAGIELAVSLLSRSSRRGRQFGTPQERSGRLQAEHLAASGHQRLGYAFPENPRVHDLARMRLDGVRRACADLGLDEPVVLTVPLDGEFAAEAVRAWRTAERPVTGICAFNDNTALAVLAGLRQLGLSAPDDLAVVGVDDTPAAQLAAPPLTTVVIDQQAVAQRLAQTIVRALAGEPAPRWPGSDIVRLIRRASA